MRYVRFLKPPRIIHDDQSSTKYSLTCLITITSDLGDSFFPEHISVHVEKRYPSSTGNNFKRFKWTNGMRALQIKLDHTFSQTENWALHVGLDRLNVYGTYETDTFKVLFDDKKSQGIVSAYSAPLDPKFETQEAERLVERRFEISDGRVIRIWEETGESIARHIWDAGVCLSYNIDRALAHPELEIPIANPLQVGPGKDRLRIVELGTGCGIVGITLATLIEQADVTLTDLPEAEEIVTRNINQAELAKGSTLHFQTLDWEDEALSGLNKSSDTSARTDFDVIIVADCTYNPDSSPALVNTTHRIAKTSPEVTIIVAMKKRHSSEEVFFDLMSEAGFLSEEEDHHRIKLPCDDGCSGEVVHVYIYRHKNSARYTVAKEGSRLRSDEGNSRKKKKRRIKEKTPD